MGSYKDDIIYQIYPRSYADSNGDGIGDLRGIIGKLDYLSELGITAIWLSPVFLSPMEDMGYDIASYYHIDPIFGSDEDMDELIAKAGEKGIRIILDMVLNHTSKEHEWFKKARQSKDNPYRDYYIFRDSPNSICSTFGGSAWEYNEPTNDYYFHLYAPGQPDLNWDNEAMREDLYKACNYWLDKGVYGFRLDVIENIGKEVDRGIIQNGPTLHQRLHELNRKTFGRVGGISIGECWCADAESRLLYVDPKREELSMLFLFDDFTQFYSQKYEKWVRREFDARDLRNAIFKRQLTEKERSWDTLFWNNHDLPRAICRYGELGDRAKKAKCFFAATLFLRGTPFIYQGDEIGMVNGHFKSKEDYRDIETLNAFPILREKGLSEKETWDAIASTSRDTARIPMRWEDKPGYGFTSATPWLDGGPDRYCVASEENDPDSILSFYKTAIKLRKSDKFKETIKEGDFAPILTETDLLAYKRICGGKTLTVIANLTNTKRENAKGEGELVLSNYGDEDNEIRPFEVRVYWKE